MFHRADMVREKVSQRLVKFYFLFLICLGIDSGYLRTLGMKSRVVLTCVCVIGSIANTILPIISIISEDEDALYEYVTEKKPQQAELNKYADSIWYGLMSFQFAACSLVAFSSSNYGLYNFLIDLDKSSKFKLSGGYGHVLFLTNIFAVGMFTLQMVVAYAYWFFEDDIPANDAATVIRFVIYNLGTLGIHLLILELFLVYYFAYKYVKRAFELFKNSEIGIEAVQNYYINIARILDKIKPRYNALLIIELFVDLPKMIALLWLILAFWKNNMHWSFYTSTAFYPIMITIQLTLPALMVDRVKSQVNSLRLLFHEILLKEGENLAVSRLLRYVEARPLDHQLGNVVPTDLRLPIALFNLCTTYFIVILQFTHLVD